MDARLRHNLRRGSKALLARYRYGIRDTGGGEGVEVGRERDARKLAFEVGCEAGAIFRVVEEGVSGVEDVPLGDVVVGVVAAEFSDRPVGDVLLAMCAIFVVYESFEYVSSLKLLVKLYCFFVNGLYKLSLIFMSVKSTELSLVIALLVIVIHL